MGRRRLSLGTTQETLLIPLYGRAVESGKKRPALHDAKAVEMVGSIDYDFAKFDGGRSLLGSVLRTLIFDDWVRAFLARHPGGTVVEIGTGLNTRFERLDNGAVRWFDVDLPDVIDLRRHFFADDERRTMIACSVLDHSWADVVRESDGPYLIISEAVLLYLSEEDVRTALSLISSNFPGAELAFDTGSRLMMDFQHQHDSLKKVDAVMTWACDEPRRIEDWGIGLRLRESRTVAEPQVAVRRALPVRYRVMLPVLRRFAGRKVGSYRLNLFDVSGVHSAPE